MANNFWSHITRRPARVLTVIVSYNARDSKVSNPKISFLIENKILRFQVAMDNFMLVKVLEANYDVCNEEFSLGLAKFPFCPNMVSEIASVQVIHDKIEIFPILECALHVNQERMMQVCQ